MIDQFQDQKQTMQDVGEFTSDQQTESFRAVPPSLLNKSSIHCFEFNGKQLTQLPDIPISTQKIDLSFNMISDIRKLMCLNLKELDISNNMVSRLPLQLNQMSSLCILKANMNKITTLPFLPRVRHLQLSKNPINFLTVKCPLMPIQFILIDWLPYITKHSHSSAWREMAILVTELTINEKQTNYIDFKTLFKCRKDNEITLEYCLHEAIARKDDFFVQVVRQEYKHCNFNAMVYNREFILEKALIEQYDNILTLFTIDQNNLIDDFVFMENLMLVCQYGNIQLFDYFLSFPTKKILIIEKEQQIISHIVKNFDQTYSIGMLIKIVNLCGYNDVNKKVFVIPQNSSILQSESVAESLTYIITHKILSEVFDFRFSLMDPTQPLLHFAMANRKPELVKLILQKFGNPFVKNIYGKSAKSIRGSVLSRKFVWKYEKKQIKKLFSQQNLEQKNTFEKQFVIDTMFLKPKKKNFNKIYSSPMKQLSGSVGSSMNSRIVSAEKLKEIKETLDRLKSSRYIQEFQNCIDLDQPTTLTLFERFHRSALTTVQKSYPNFAPQIQKKVYSLSPLSLCSEPVNSCDSQSQCTFEIKKRKTQKMSSSCLQVCQQPSSLDAAM